MRYFLPPVKIVRFSLKEINEAIENNQKRGFDLVGEIKRDFITKREFNYRSDSNKRLSKRIYDGFQVSEKFIAIMHKEVSKEEYLNFMNKHKKSRFNNS